MIECVKMGKKPVYEVECFECHSLLRYTRADVSLLHITCPVCGCSIMVYYDRVDDTESTVPEASE